MGGHHFSNLAARSGARVNSSADGSNFAANNAVTRPASILS